MADQIEVVNTWVATTLGTDAALITAIPRDDDASKARAFYSGATDQQTSRPFIRWNLAAVTAQKVMGGSTNHVICVLDVTVEGEEDSTLEDIMSLQARVKTLLDNVTGTAAGGSVFESTWEMSIPIVTKDEGIQYAQITNRFRVGEQ